MHDGGAPRQDMRKRHVQLVPDVRAQRCGQLLRVRCEKQRPAAQPAYSVSRGAEERRRRAVRRSRRAENRRSAGIQKSLQSRAQRMVAGLVVPRKPAEPQLARPVRLPLGQPFRKQTNYTAWRVHPLLAHTRHRRQTQLVPPAIELREYLAIDEPPVDHPPHGALQPSR